MTLEKDRREIGLFLLVRTEIAGAETIVVSAHDLFIQEARQRGL